MLKFIYFTYLIVVCSTVVAQSPTIGVLYEQSGIAEGYTLFSPEENTNTYLINNCGEVVNQWSFSEKPGLSSYLTEDGNLVRSGKDSIEVKDWNNNLIWSFHVNSLGVNQHHDIQPLPNGNIIVLVADNYSQANIISQGKDASYSAGQFKLDRLIELEPNGFGQANIVWEWKFYDHLIQDYDSGKPNFGVVADHPELMDLNYASESEDDFTHVNAVDYNADLDQLMLSVRHFSEILIIDHSTTTLEASSHSGGTYGKGGDFLWRWGNPETYQGGTVADKKLGRQHDAKWITEGTHIGKISVFNNGGDGTTAGSSVHIINPSDTNGVYYIDGDMFLPSDYTWSWSGYVLGELMQEARKSGVQIMSNDNALIVESDKGKITEVDPLGSVLWVYEVPHGDILYNQFTTPSNNDAFRAHRYPIDYPGFDAVSFNNTGIIENENAISDNCMPLGLDDVDLELNVYPNPTESLIMISSDKTINKIELHSLHGRILLTTEVNYLDVSELPKGIYIVKVYVGNKIVHKKITKN